MPALSSSLPPAPAGSSRRGRTPRRRCRARCATSSPGANPARSMARTSVSSACSLVANSGHQPPSSATPAQRAGLAHQRCRRRGRPRRSSPAPRRSCAAAGQTTMKSWMSTRRPACAPPPKIWICGSGSVPAPAPPRWRYSGTPAAAAAACAAAIETARMALAPRRVLVRRAVELDQAPRPAPPGRRRPAQHGARRSSPFTLADRPRHVVAAEGRAAVAQVQRLAACRWRRRPGRWRGRPRRRPAARSASTVGPAAAVPDAAAMHEDDLGVASSRPVPCRQRRRLTSLEPRRRRASSARATRRTRSLSGSAVMYSTGDLPSTRARSKPGSRRAARARAPPRVSQSTPAR